jgi:hypothetical protein
MEYYMSYNGKIFSVPMSIQYAAVSGTQSTSSTSYQGIGCLVFGPSDIYAGNTHVTRTIGFASLMEVSDAAVTGSIRLVDLSTGLAVTDSEFSTTSAAATSPEIVFGDLTPGSSPALSPSTNFYEVQIKRTGGTESDLVICKSSFIIVTWS